MLRGVNSFTSATGYALLSATIVLTSISSLGERLFSPAYWLPRWLEVRHFLPTGPFDVHRLNRVTALYQAPLSDASGDEGVNKLKSMRIEGSQLQITPK